jgi:hypothetical protein
MDEVTAACRVCGTTVTLPRPDEPESDADAVTADKDLSAVVDRIEEAETAAIAEDDLRGVTCPHGGQPSSTHPLRWWGMKPTLRSD